MPTGSKSADVIEETAQGGSRPGRTNQSGERPDSKGAQPAPQQQHRRLHRRRPKREAHPHFARPPRRGMRQQREQADARHRERTERKCRDEDRVEARRRVLQPHLVHHRARPMLRGRRDHLGNSSPQRLDERPGIGGRGRRNRHERHRKPRERNVHVVPRGPRT